jgi:hypothetical protein
MTGELVVAMHKCVHCDFFMVITVDSICDKSRVPIFLII